VDGWTDGTGQARGGTMYMKCIGAPSNFNLSVCYGLAAFSVKIMTPK